MNGAGRQRRQRFVQQHVVVGILMVMMSMTLSVPFGRFFSSPLHQRLVAFHAKDTLRRPCIFEVLDLLLTVPTSKTGRAECLVAREDGEILDFVPTRTAAIRAIIANQRAVAEEQKICIRIQKGTACIAPEAVYVPSIARCQTVSISIS